MYITDLVIIKYFGNIIIEIKRVVFTYPDLLPSALVVEVELIHVYRTVGIHLLWKSCDVRSVSMASWNGGRRVYNLRYTSAHTWSKSL